MNETCGCRRPLGGPVAQLRSCSRSTEIVRRSSNFAPIGRNAMHRPGCRPPATRPSPRCVPPLDVAHAGPWRETEVGCQTRGGSISQYSAKRSETLPDPDRRQPACAWRQAPGQLRGTLPRIRQTVSHLKATTWRFPTLDTMTVPSFPSNPFPIIHQRMDVPPGVAASNRNPTHKPARGRDFDNSAVGAARTASEYVLPNSYPPAQNASPVDFSLYLLINLTDLLLSRWARACSNRSSASA